MEDLENYDRKRERKMPKTKTPYVALYPSDYLADTAHLSLEEHGVYWRLLLHYYQHAKPLPGDFNRLARVIGANSVKEKTALRFILDEYFAPHNEDGIACWRHSRADDEIQKASEKYQSNREKAKRAAEARWGQQTNAPSMHQALPEQCHPEPEPEPEEKNISNANALLVDSVAADQCRDEEILTDKPKEQTLKPDKPKPRLVPPPCPHQQIVELYHEILPMCPRVKEMTPARKAHLKARWLGARKRQDLSWWRDFFGYVAKSEFLTGNGPSYNGRKPFLADLGWLVKQENFVKIWEGKYEDEKPRQYAG